MKREERENEKGEGEGAKERQRERRSGKEEGGGRRLQRVGQGEGDPDAACIYYDVEFPHPLQAEMSRDKLLLLNKNEEKNPNL